MATRKKKTDQPDAAAPADAALPAEEVQAIADQAAEDIVALAEDAGVAETVEVNVTETPVDETPLPGDAQRVLDEAHVGTPAQPDPEPPVGSIDSDLSDPVLRDLHGLRGE